MIGLRGHHGYVLDGLKLLPEIKVTGIGSGCEDDISPLKAKCEALGHNPKTFTDYRQMLDDEKPDIVCVDGPFELHAEMCVEALHRNINVFCEKPISLTITDLERVRKAFNSTSTVHLASMVGLRYAPAFMTAWKEVKNGAVGKVKMITTQKSYKLGKRSEFFKKRSTYGGTIPWVGSHSLDWIYWFSGSKFKSVYASHDSSDNFDLGDLEITSLYQAVMENGVLASGNIDYLRPASAPAHGDDRVRVAGTEGVIEVMGGKVNLMNASGNREIECKPDRQIFADFVHHVQGKSISLVDAEQTFDLTEACLLARESADSGKVMFFKK